MGNRKISSDLKECALRLWNTGWDIKDIQNALGVSRASIYRWESIFAEFGTINRLWKEKNSDVPAWLQAPGQPKPGLISAAEVRFSPVLCQFFQTPNQTTGSGSAVWSNSGPNVTERVREVRFAFEPGSTTKLGSVPSINPYPS
ncbi:hypothetical protein EDB19DRAFT_1824767 [Suillus lakei]|nr:hypothetical protein EDB19DRAFT_1824767 [Suillus lakei]